jgi:hypothetical protein
MLVIVRTCCAAGNQGEGQLLACRSMASSKYPGGHYPVPEGHHPLADPGERIHAVLAAWDAAAA